MSGSASPMPRSAPISAMPSMPPLRLCVRAASSQSYRRHGRASARLQKGNAMHAFKLYTGKDNASHVLEGTLTLDRRTDVMAVHFKESQPHLSLTNPSCASPLGAPRAASLGAAHKMVMYRNRHFFRAAALVPSAAK